MSARSGQTTTHRPRFLEICVRCLRVLRHADHVFYFHAWGSRRAACVDDLACRNEQRENQARHQREIARRVKAASAGTTLLVIQDRFGHLYGYGNLYLLIARGASVEEILAAELARYQHHEEDGPLVIERRIEIDLDGEMV